MMATEIILPASASPMEEYPLVNGSLAKAALMRQIAGIYNRCRNTWRLVGAKFWDEPVDVYAGTVYTTNTTSACSVHIRCDQPFDFASVELQAYIWLYLPADANYTTSGLITELQASNGTAGGANNWVLGPSSFRYANTTGFDKYVLVTLAGTGKPPYGLNTALTADSDPVWLNVLCTSLTKDNVSAKTPKISAICVYARPKYKHNMDIAGVSEIAFPYSLPGQDIAQSTLWNDWCAANEWMYRFLPHYPEVQLSTDDDAAAGQVTGYSATISSTTYVNLWDNTAIANSGAEFCLNVKGRTYDGTNIRLLVSWYLYRAAAGAYKVQWKPAFSGSWADGITGTFSSTAGWIAAEGSINVGTNEWIILRVGAKKDTASTATVKSDAMAIRHIHASILDAIG